MHAQLWDFFVDTKYNESYAQLYFNRICFWSRFYESATIVFSATGIIGWWLSTKYPVLWSIILGLSSLANVIKPSFRFSKQISAFHYYIPEMRSFAIKMEREWNEQHKIPRERFAKHLEQLKMEQVKMDLKYFGETQFPFWKGVDTQAWEQCVRFLKPFIPNEKGDDTDARYEAASNSKATALS